MVNSSFIFLAVFLIYLIVNRGSIKVDQVRAVTWLIGSKAELLTGALPDPVILLTESAIWEQESSTVNVYCNVNPRKLLSAHKSLVRKTSLSTGAIQNEIRNSQTSRFVSVPGQSQHDTVSYSLASCQPCQLPFVVERPSGDLQAQRARSLGQWQGTGARRKLNSALLALWQCQSQSWIKEEGDTNGLCYHKGSLTQRLSRPSVVSSRLAEADEHSMPDGVLFWIGFMIHRTILSYHIEKSAWIFSICENVAIIVLYVRKLKFWLLADHCS